MAGNTLLTISDITQDSLPILAGQLIFADKVNRSYDDEYGRKNAKIGGTANIRLPPRYLGTFGPGLNVEAVTESFYPISVLYQFHIDIQFTTAQLLLDADDFNERYGKPAFAAIANRVDGDTAFYYLQNVANRFGTPGTPPTSFKNFADARATLVSEMMPRGIMPCAVLNPFAQSSMSDAFKGQFNPQGAIAEMWETGMIATQTAGADWFEDPVMAAYTLGTLTGSPTLAGVTPAAAGSGLLTSGTAQNGFLNLTGLTNSAAQCQVGDTIQIAGLFPANPQTRTRYGTQLKQFVILPPGGYAQMAGPAVPGSPAFAPATLAAGTFNAATGTYTSSGSGTLQVLIGEPIILSGQFQNVVATSAFTGTPAVTINGGAAANTFSNENAYMHRDALALVTVDLPLPRTAAEASMARDKELGISIRSVTQYTVNNDAEPTRFDVAYGIAPLYRQLGVRISG